MDLINAIAKVRFASVKAQRIQIHRGRDMQVDLLCMEPGQAVDVNRGEWVYYVIKGAAGVSRATETNGELTAGQIMTAGPDEKHTITNVGEQRLICIAVGN